MIKEYASGNGMEKELCRGRMEDGEGRCVGKRPASHATRHVVSPPCRPQTPSDGGHRSRDNSVASAIVHPFVHIFTSAFDIVFR